MGSILSKRKRRSGILSLELGNSLMKLMILNLFKDKIRF
jgi:hypothetical protein